MKTVTSSIPHIHDPRDTAFSATKLRTTMLERAGSTHETLTQLITGITSNTPIGVWAELGNPETIKRSLVNNSNSVGDLVLLNEWTKISEENQFLIAAMVWTLESGTSMITLWLVAVVPKIAVKG